MEAELPPDDRSLRAPAISFAHLPSTTIATRGCPEECSTERLEVLILQNRFSGLKTALRAAPKTLPRLSCEDLGVCGRLNGSDNPSSACNEDRLPGPLNLSNDFKTVMFERGYRNGHIGILSGHLTEYNSNS